MKLLVSKRTKTLVPTKASGCSMPGSSGPSGASTQRLHVAVLGDRHGRPGALGEGGHLLQDAVLVNAEIGRLQAVDVVVLAIGHREGQDHHIDFDPEYGPLAAILRAEQNAAGGQTEEFSS